MRRTVLALTLAMTSALLSPRSAGTLDIYWIDVEGGASTLVVTPQGESVLMDAGYGDFDNRDSIRIERVTREAGLKQIDYMLTSHFHVDHVGGLAALARRVKIASFIDHGESVERGTAAGAALWQQYLGIAGERRRIAKPGERLPLAGVDLTIVVSDGKVLAQPVSGGRPNPLCDTFTAQPADLGENAKSLGYLLSAGTFQFVNLGDISWNVQHQLACPINLLGDVDLFQATHHGVRDDVLPQQMWAMAPRVTVMNNGPAKGAGPAAVEAVLRSPAHGDLWSLHRAVGNDAAHNAPEMLTANLGPTEGCQGAWIRARVQADGSYTLTNSRNGFSKTYQSK